jgi:hypothetical protein
MWKNTTIIWAMLVLAVAILGVLFGYRRLALCSDYQKTTGTIGQKFPDNHLSFDFSYAVDGQAHNGSGYAGQLGRSFDSIQVGDTITVFYDRRHPASYTLDAPSVLLVRTIGQIVAACAILPVIGIFIIRSRKPSPT